MTNGYTFAFDGKFAALQLKSTEPGDSGLVFYFFKNKKIADEMKVTMSTSIPELKGAKIVPCTLQKLKVRANRHGASIGIIQNQGDENLSG